MIAVSMNIPIKLLNSMQNTTHTEEMCLTSYPWIVASSQVLIGVNCHFLCNLRCMGTPMNGPK